MKNKMSKDEKEKQKQIQQQLLKEKYKITEVISGRIDNLSLSIDYDENWEDVANRYPVMLFTPDMENTNEHWHIQLNDEQAKILYSWLGEYLNMKGIK